METIIDQILESGRKFIDIYVCTKCNKKFKLKSKYLLHECDKNISN